LGQLLDLSQLRRMARLAASCRRSSSVPTSNDSSSRPAWASHTTGSTSVRANRLDAMPFWGRCP